MGIEQGFTPKEIIDAQGKLSNELQKEKEGSGVDTEVGARLLRSLQSRKQIEPSALFSHLKGELGKMKESNPKVELQPLKDKICSTLIEDWQNNVRGIDTETVNFIEEMGSNIEFNSEKVRGALQTATELAFKNGDDDQIRGLMDLASKKGLNYLFDSIKKAFTESPK